MDQILDIDADAMTVTVQPGVVWQKLEKVLHKQGLALRTYLSSAPSSTVGGWLAQGGVGFGAYEYGAFRDNVVSCRAVLPDGDVHEFVDDPAAAPQQSLDLISEAEGITGLIIQVTIRVRRHEPEVIRGARFDNAGDLARALNAIREAGLPLWSVSFVNPKMALEKSAPAAHGAWPRRRDPPSRHARGVRRHPCRTTVTPVVAGGAALCPDCRRRRRLGR